MNVHAFFRKHLDIGRYCHVDLARVGERAVVNIWFVYREYGAPFENLSHLVKYCRFRADVLDMKTEGVSIPIFDAATDQLISPRGQ
jgi:hypothetical protein